MRNNEIYTCVIVEEGAERLNTSSVTEYKMKRPEQQLETKK